MNNGNEFRLVSESKQCTMQWYSAAKTSGDQLSSSKLREEATEVRLTIASKKKPRQD